MEPQLNANDHDLLIEMKTRLNDLIGIVNEIKNGTSVKISNHEERLQKLELSRNNLKLQMGIYISIGAFIAGLLIYHIIGKGI